LELLILSGKLVKVQLKHIKGARSSSFSSKKSKNRKLEWDQLEKHFVEEKANPSNLEIKILGHLEEVNDFRGFLDI